MGAHPPEKDTLKDAMKNLNMSTEEVSKFEKAFKDPEFIKMFSEYAQEIQDPKHRAETDAYLRQLEAESRVEEVYGKGVQLIVPQEGFVVKTTDKVTREKVFINVCHSDKVEPCKGTKTTDPINPSRVGTAWDIPLSLGKPKTGADKKGQNCTVFDFCVHPKTKDMAVRDARFKGIVVESAIENIEKNHGLRLDRSWKQPKMTYKGVEGAEVPHAMAVRTGPEAPEAVDGRIAPLRDSQRSEIKKQAGEAAVVAEDIALPAPPEGQAAPRSGFSFPAPKRMVQEVKPIKPGQIGYKYPSGEVCPQYQVIERGSIDLASAWGDAGRGIDVLNTIPKELVLRVELPGCTSAAGMDLEMEKKAISLCIPGKFRLEKSLAHAVDEGKAGAKFDKSKQRLEVTLPVVPPPPQSPMRAAQATTEPSLVEELSSRQTIQEQPTEERPQEVTREATLQTSEEATEETGADSPKFKQRWAEWLARQDMEREAAAQKVADAGETPSGGDTEGTCTEATDVLRVTVDGSEEFVPAPSFQGSRPGYVFKKDRLGLGYYKDTAAAPPSSKSRAAAALAGAGLSANPSLHLAGREGTTAQPQPKAPLPKLQPRLNNTLAEELD